MPESSAYPARTTRAFHLLLATVVVMAFIGFFVGIRQGKTPPDLTPPRLQHLADETQAVPAIAWRDYDRRVFGPNRSWRSTLASLAQPPVEAPDTEPTLSESARSALQAVRATRRAFAGAPPVVPHPIDQMGTASCMACHEEGLFIGKGKRAPKMSHPMYASCTQCHVESASPELPAAVVAENTFERAPVVLAGHRAWKGAPPTVPHSTWMRENCLSCHGPTGPHAIRTSHPARTSCLQCHAPSAVLDQMAIEDNPAFLGSSGGARSETR